MRSLKYARRPRRPVFESGTSLALFIILIVAGLGGGMAVMLYYGAEYTAEMRERHWEHGPCHTHTDKAYNTVPALPPPPEYDGKQVRSPTHCHEQIGGGGLFGRTRSIETYAIPIDDPAASAVAAADRTPPPWPHEPADPIAAAHRAAALEQAASASAASDPYGAALEQAAADGTITPDERAILDLFRTAAPP